jgi:hypothetical protein
MKKYALGIFLVVSFFFSSGLRNADADAVIDWNVNAGKAAIAACIAPLRDPLHEVRMYAMMHLAIHDALNAIDRQSRPYAFDSQAPAGASPAAAVAAAARDVLIPLINQIPAPFPPICITNGVASVEADYASALAAITDGEAKTQGLAVGQVAAAAILALRANDGSDTPLIDSTYPQGTLPGEWRFTPGFSFFFGPGWAEVTPFVLKENSQFRPDPPNKVTGKKYAKDFHEVKSLGGDGTITPSARTPEQTQIARFWVESSPLGWNRIARTVSTAEGLDLWENARLFGLLNMALIDGYIGGFEAKIYYNFWRPVTAIRLAEIDGNPATNADPTWTPLQPTPPIPDYPSTHSVEGGAAAQVLKRFFGDDDVSFSTCSLTLPVSTEQCGGVSEVRRSFTSFTQAANENGLSRILVGFHFRDAVNAGIKHGRKIGNYAVNRFLKPVKK